MSVYITIKSNWKLIDKELNRLDRVPEEAAANLDIVLAAGFFKTQQSVHIETGSLKSSGKVFSEFKMNEWKGTISYGGPSTGVNNPVTYAIYEKARGTTWLGPSSVKGDHDFMRPLTKMDEAWVKAIMKALE